ncbi:MAG: hypothetical protein KAR39_12695 [Thermoplasmata archaeon]|nr:hypothetical protein [Thermoplasmata archaeon]
MKKIVEYECEICFSTFKEKKNALACEAQGLPEEYPIGCLHGTNNYPDSFYAEITFAVARNLVGPRRFGHMNAGSSWACRDIPGVGDSLGEDRCGTGSLKLSEYDAHLDPEHPTFKRMVAWLESQDIPVTVWNGKKAIPLEEYLLWST